jgi:hypothetical protein
MPELFTGNYRICIRLTATHFFHGKAQEDNSDGKRGDACFVIILASL